MATLGYKKSNSNSLSVSVQTSFWISAAREMGVISYPMLLLAICLHCANSRVATTVKDEEKKPIDCSHYLMRPEDMEKMTKCFDNIIIQQIIANVTEATTKTIKGLEQELPQMRSSFTAQLQELKNKVQQLENKINSSNCQCNKCKFLQVFVFCSLSFVTIFRSSRLSRLEKQRLP